MSYRARRQVYVDAGQPIPGFLSSEFWVTLIPMLLSVLAIAFPGRFGSSHLDNATVQGLALLAAMVSAGIYAIARAITKRPHPIHVLPVFPQPPNPLAPPVVVHPPVQPPVPTPGPFGPAPFGPAPFSPPYTAS